METEKKMTSGIFTGGKIEVSYQEYTRGDHDRHVEIGAEIKETITDDAY